jgi:hypothetical protein
VYCPSEIRANCGFQGKSGESTKKKEAKHPPRKEGRKEGRGVTTRRGKSKNDIEDNSN